MPCPGPTARAIELLNKDDGHGDSTAEAGHIGGGL
jgi:hypothetical protein